MALNLSRRPIFPSQMLEDALVSPIKLRSGRIVNEGIGENIGFGRGGHDHCTCSSEGSSCCHNSDVFYFLPVDPFGMDISSRFTAITGWLEDLDMNNVGYVSDVRGGVDGSNYSFFAGLNLLGNNAVAMKFQPFPGLGRDYNFFNRYSSPNDVYPNIVGLQNMSEDIGSSSGAWTSVYFRDANNTSLFGGGVGSESVNKGSYECIDSSYISSSVDLGSRSASGNASIGFGDSVGCGTQDDAINVSVAVSDNIPGYCCEKRGNYSTEASNCFKDSSSGCFAECDGTPHYAFYLALGYLGLRDLLSVDRVCKSLHSALQMENNLWRSLHVHRPLNEKITDEVLLHLTDRAQGKLEFLSLVECPRITDDGLRRVLERNPGLSKLSVPGCTRLSINNLLESLRTLKLLGTLKLKHVRIGGIYGVTEEQFDELKFLLGVEGKERLGDHKPHFYRGENLYLPCEDNRIIDIEICPRCQKARLVYDCPHEACMMKGAASQVCRACTLCIARCIQCGRCINGTEYEETFCLEPLCSICSSQESTKNPEIARRNITPSEHADLGMDHQIDGIVCRG